MSKELINKQAVEDAIAELDVVDYDAVSELLPRLLSEGNLTLDTSVYVPKDPSATHAHGVGKYLVYDNPDQKNPVSVWIFAFGPKQKTTIHDHLYKGTVTVLEGPVSEKFYQPTANRSAKLSARYDRYRFHSNHDDLSDTFVHQLKRRKGLGDGISVTLHIYNMKAELLDEKSSMYKRNLKIIYNKDLTADKSNKPPYQDQHPDVPPNQTMGM